MSEFFDELRKFIIENVPSNEFLEISFKYKLNCGVEEEYTYRDISQSTRKVNNESKINK